MVLSGLTDLLDDGDFLSSENLHDVVLSDLFRLVLLAVALLFLVDDDLLTGLLADLDDRGDLGQTLLLQFHFFLEGGGSLDSDSLLLDEDESLFLSDSLEALLFFSLPSSVGFLLSQASHSELFFSLSSELLFDFLLSLDESDVSGDHIDVVLDSDDLGGYSSAEGSSSTVSSSHVVD